MAPTLLVALVVLLIVLPLGLVFLYAFSTTWFANHWWGPQEMGGEWLFSIFETDTTSSNP